MRTLLVTLLLSALVVVPANAQLRVERVVDGDTYLLTDGQRVRAIGMDTPEKHMSAKLRRDAERTGSDIATIRALGERASRHAEELLTGKYVELEYDPENVASHHKDRYGRTLAYVWVLESGARSYMVNLRMIADGYANAYTVFPFRYTDSFLRAQREARAAERGLWAEDGF